jgi:hypothetical protein
MSLHGQYFSLKAIAHLYRYVVIACDTRERSVVSLSTLQVNNDVLQ